MLQICATLSGGSELPHLFVPWLIGDFPGAMDGMCRKEGRERKKLLNLERGLKIENLIRDPSYGLIVASSGEEYVIVNKSQEKVFLKAR